MNLSPRAMRTLFSFQVTSFIPFRKSFLRPRQIDPPNTKGFTLLELVIVLSIISLLAVIAQPALFRMATVRARETVLKKDLYVFRDVIDQFRADQGRYPDSLSDLVDAEYLRSLPVDPFTRSADSWVPVPYEGDEGGIFDVKSGSDGSSAEGVAYSEW
jgi:general secretion pathway protein G